MRISYSAIETFQICPLKYKFQEIDKIRVPKSKEAIFGSVIHSTLKFFHSSDPLFPNLEKLLEFYKKKWPESGAVEWMPEEEKAFFNQGLKMLESYYNNNDPRKFNVIDLESYFEVPIKGQEGSFHLFVGKIDRIDKLEDESIEVIDYKTVRRMPPQNKIDSDLQLSLYHLAVVHRWPSMRRSVKLSLYFLRHGEKLTTARTGGQLEETKNQLLDKIKEIQESNFEPKPGSLCDWCGYRKICPMWKHLYKSEIRNLKSEKIKELVKEYFELQKKSRMNEKRLAEIKLLINQYLDEEKLERVFGDEGYITRLLQKRYGYDLVKIKEILELLGKWDEVIAVDFKKLEKVLKSLPENIREEIKKTRRVEKEFKVLISNRNLE